MVSLEGKNEQTCFVILPSKLYEWLATRRGTQVAEGDGLLNR
jgi:hypothetical protein